MSGDNVEFVLNGEPVTVPRSGSLLDALREELGLRSPKDGCSPQGQCGCCTVWVDGQPRISCVTPIGRVRGREVTTVEGLDTADVWAESFSDHGGSQCGFCTPGIIMRAAALDATQRTSPPAVERALLAHMCRCTGWQPIVESIVGLGRGADRSGAIDRSLAERRATLEGGVPQRVGADVALGRAGFADDTAPTDALVAVRGANDSWVVAETLAEARDLSGKVQGRRTTASLRWPIELPDGDWARTLRTTWVEPAYLEPDASWCEPGGTPMSSHGNGGAFGGKVSGSIGQVARRLADEHGRAVRVLSTREDVVHHGPKRPPVALGIGDDGTGVLRAVRTPGLAELVGGTYPGIRLEEIDVSGPATSIALRGAGWAEIAIAMASLSGGLEYSVTSPSGATATARVGDDGAVQVRVACGQVLDRTVLRSYCIGAVHMALGWVRSEGLAVDDEGAPLDLTIRSFGILRASETPPIEIEVIETDGEPGNGSDAVFAAVATAAWAAEGFAPRWPTGR